MILELPSFKAVTSHVVQAKGGETKNTQKVRTSESLDVFSQRELHSQAVYAQSLDVCYHLGLSLGLLSLVSISLTAICLFQGLQTCFLLF